MNRHILSTAIALALPTFAFANSQVAHYGPTLSTGPESNHLTTFGPMNNPALNALVVDKGEHWRMGGGSFQTNLELGPVDDFVDDLDELIDIIDDPKLVEDSIDETVDRLNETIGKMGESGYLVSTTSLTLPIAPLYFKSNSLETTFSAEVSNDTQIRISVLENGDFAFNNQNGTFDTATSVYMKSGVETRLSFGLGREFFAKEMARDYNAKLYIGARFNLINLQLSKQVFLLTALDGKDIEDVIEDEYENNLEKSSNASIDLGLLWQAEKYSVGFTLANINQPEFEYGEVGRDCPDRGENNTERTNCEVAAFFTREGLIRDAETHQKHALATVDGTYLLKDNWLVSGSYDLASYDDIVGMQNQWMSVSTSYYAKNRWVPDMRAGFHKNLVGSSLSTVNLGLTFSAFHTSFNADVKYGLESVTVDESSGPRTLGISLSLEEQF